MAGRGSRSKTKPAGKPKPAERPAAGGPSGGTALRDVAPALRARGKLELALGFVLVIAAGVVTMVSVDGSDLRATTFLFVYALAVVGVVAIAIGAARIDRRPETPIHADVRRRIYGVLALVFAVAYAGIMWKVIPNRLPSAMLHLATIPVFTLTMAIGALTGGRSGWWLAVVSGSVVLLSTIMLIARILVSAAFLAGVYGAFGKAAATFALVAVALIVEAVALFPICLVKFMMSRAGRRAHGV